MSCTRRQYDGPRQARKMTRGVANSTRAYFCNECRKWHITNRDNKDSSYREPEIAGVPRFKWKHIASVNHVEAERRHKRRAKDRDGWRCRVPGCVVWGAGRVHAMHVNGKKMGGDKLLRVSGDPSCFVTGCAYHHGLIDQKRIRMVVGERGGDGPVAFVVRPAAGWFGFELGPPPSATDEIRGDLTTVR